MVTDSLFQFQLETLDWPCANLKTGQLWIPLGSFNPNSLHFRRRNEQMKLQRLTFKVKDKPLQNPHPRTLYKTSATYKQTQTLNSKLNHHSYLHLTLLYQTKPNQTLTHIHSLTTPLHHIPKLPTYLSISIPNSPYINPTEQSSFTPSHIMDPIIQQTSQLNLESRGREDVVSPNPADSSPEADEQPTATTKTISEFKKRELSGMLKEEPLLRDNENRFVLFPIEHHEVWEMYKKAEVRF